MSNEETEWKAFLLITFLKLHFIYVQIIKAFGLYIIAQFPCYGNFMRRVRFYSINKLNILFINIHVYNLYSETCALFELQTSATVPVFFIPWTCGNTPYTVGICSELTVVTLVEWLMHLTQTFPSYRPHPTELFSFIFVLQY